MQEALPEDLWFFIILVALLILAYLWNDKAGSGSSEVSTGTGGGTDGSGDDDTEIGHDRPPRIHVHSKGSQKVGEEIWLKADFDSGTGEVQDLNAKINGEEVDIDDLDEENDIFVSNPSTVREGRNKLEASIKTDVAERTDSTGFKASEDTPEDEKGPTIRAEYKIIDEQKGKVRIEAQATPRTSPIKKTEIVLTAGERKIGDTSNQGDACVMNADKLPQANYVITAITEDMNGLKDDYTEAFTLGFQGPGRGPGVPPGVYNPQINFEPEINIEIGQGEASGGRGFEPGTDSVFDFLDDFRAFTKFMNERESDNLDMSPYSASSAFAGAFYSGDISLDHKPVEVVEKISQINNEVQRGRAVEQVIDASLSVSELDDVKLAIDTYHAIEYT